MLLRIMVVILLILQGVEGHLVKSSAPYEEYSHQEVNVQAKDVKALFKMIPNKHSLKQFTSNGKQNVVQYAPNWSKQHIIQKQLPNISHKIIEKGVKENILHYSASEGKFLPNTQNPKENYNILEDKKDFGINMKHNSFENHKSQQEPSYMKDQHQQKSIKASLHQQSQSQFINIEEKALYLQFVEALERLVSYFSASKSAIKNQDTINEVESTLKQSKQGAVTSKIQPSSIKPQQLDLPQQVLPPGSKNFELQTIKNTINDTKMMAKARKKLYFIICTLSFGATCIFLIKLLQGRQEKNIIHSKSKKIKIPMEDFYIQQI